MILQANDESHLVIRLSEYTALLQQLDFLQKEAKEAKDTLEKYKEDNAIVFINYYQEGYSGKVTMKAIEADHTKLQNILNKSKNRTT